MASDLAVNVMSSFVVGALSVCTLSVTAERFGSKLAGALGGFPATIMASFLFIALANGPLAAADSTTVVPLAMGFYGLLLVAFILLLPRGLATALVGGLLTWAGLTAALLSFGHPPFVFSLAGWAVLVIFCWWIVEYRIDVPATGSRKVTFSATQVVGRMVSGGSLVAVSVLLGATSNPTLAGLAAAFPAVTVSTLLVTHRSGGVVLARAVAKAIMLSGMVNGPVAATAVRLFFPMYGAIWGTILASLIACVSSALLFVFLRRASS